MSPKRENQNKNEQTLEWLPSLQSSNEVSMDFGKLNSELKSLLSWLAIKPRELSIRRKVANEMNNILVEKFPGSFVYVVGSAASGMMLPNSDMNFFFRSENIGMNLKSLKSLLSSNSLYSNCQFITDFHGRPHFTFKHTGSGIPLTLTVDDECSTSFSGFIKYVRKVPEYKSLYCVVKYLIQQKRDNRKSDPNVSMLIYLMVLYYLQVHEGSNRDNKSLGELYYGFLQFSGTNLDLQESTLLSLKNYMALKANKQQSERKPVAKPSVCVNNTFMFAQFVQSLEKNLNILVDITSDKTSANLNDLKDILQSTFGTLSPRISNSAYSGNMLQDIYVAEPRLCESMMKSPLLGNVSNNSSGSDSDTPKSTSAPVMDEYTSKRRGEAMKAMCILLALLCLALALIIVLLYIKHKSEAANIPPRIILGDIIQIVEGKPKVHV